MRIALALIAALAAGPVTAQDAVSAAYVRPTTAYGHGAVENGEYAGLRVTFEDGSAREAHVRGGVFEDTAPRLTDLDGDGAPEIITVYSTDVGGAMVQVWTAAGGTLRLAGHNRPIGQRHRWLAIAGIADFNGDGLPEVAYVDRPHLAKELVFLQVELADGTTTFREIFRLEGVTNHHLGAPEIEGGVRNCADQPPAVLAADAAWKTMVVITWEAGNPVAKPLGPYTGAAGFAPHLRCD